MLTDSISFCRLILNFSTFCLCTYLLHFLLVRTWPTKRKKYRKLQTNVVRFCEQNPMILSMVLGCCHNFDIFLSSPAFTLQVALLFGLCMFSYNQPLNLLGNVFLVSMHPQLLLFFFLVVFQQYPIIWGSHWQTSRQKKKIIRQEPEARGKSWGVGTFAKFHASKIWVCRGYFCAFPASSPQE